MKDFVCILYVAKPCIRVSTKHHKISGIIKLDERCIWRSVCLCEHVMYKLDECCFCLVLAYANMYKLDECCILLSVCLCEDVLYKLDECCVLFISCLCEHVLLDECCIWFSSCLCEHALYTCSSVTILINMHNILNKCTVKYETIYVTGETCLLLCQLDKQVKTEIRL